MDTATKYGYTLIAQALHIERSEEVSALACGIDDGYEQGFELSTGITYHDLDCQWAYDTGTYIGACLKLRANHG